MANNGPKISVSADLSSLDAEIQKLNASISQMGEHLKSESGKAEINFEGPQKQLSALIAQADKLTAALSKTDKTSASYAKNLKAAAQAMADAAKLSNRIESIGGASNNNASNYFNDYSSNLRQEATETVGEASAARDRERTQARLAEERQASNTRWANRAARFAGFVGGTVAGGGSGYAAAGAGVGSMLPGIAGTIAGGIGGVVGGAVDKYISPAREEAKIYSELRRGIGSTVVDFEKLRGSVRSVVQGLGITDVEAANLAKSFAKTTALTGDKTDDIAESIKTAGGYAQGFGMAPDQATQFFAQMRLTGASNNDKDNRKLAVMIAESVQRGGTSAKMDEVLGAISGFATHASQLSLTDPSVGQFASYLASLTGSNYSGIKGDPNSAAALMASADASVRQGGAMGEASQNHWLFARQEAFKNMRWEDNSIMEGAGLTGNIADQYSKDSPVYQRAVENKDWKTVEHMDKLREEIASSGMDNNFKIGMAHIKKISQGDSAIENMNYRGMFGGTPQQAAASMKLWENDPGLGKLDKQLQKYGVSTDKVNPSQIAAFSELLSGGEEAQVKQYEKLLSSGKLTGDEKDKADRIQAKEGYGEEFKKLLLKLTEKYDSDSGKDAQTTTIDLQSKIQRGVTDLITIENTAKDTLLEILKHFEPNSPYLQKMIDKELSGIKEGVNSTGKDFNGGNVLDVKKREIDQSLMDINEAGSQEEKNRLAKKMYSKIKANNRGYPAESVEWLNKAIEIKKPEEKEVEPERAEEQATISAEVAPTKPAASSNETAPTKQANQSSKGLTKRQKTVADMVKSETRYDNLFKEAGEAAGVDPLVVKQLAAQESGINPNATNKNSNGTTDLGMMQHNSKYAGERGINDKNWNDPKANVMAGAKFFKTLLNKSKGNYREAFRRYNGTGEQAEKYADNAMATYNAVHRKQDKQAYNRKDDGQKHDNVILASAKPDDFSSKFSWSAIKKDTMDEKPKDFLDYLIKPAGADERDQLPESYKPRKEQQSNHRFEGTFVLKDSKGNAIAEPIHHNTHIGAPRAAGAH